MSNIEPCRSHCCPKLYLEYNNGHPIVTKGSLFIVTDDYGGMVKLNVEQLDRLLNEAMDILINYNAL